MRFRNWAFDKGVTRSFKFDFPVICVGNLSTGGTGKTPHIEYIIRLLKRKYTLGVVSRGYGRKTRGFYLVTENSDAQTVGDEPLQIKQNHLEANVAVCEQRIIAIPTLLQEVPDTEVILLDDAFQHRYVRAGLNIMLTDYSKMFYDDWVLPAGNLREARSGYKRADIIVVTKCPLKLTEKEKQSIKHKIKPLAQQLVVFSHIKYGIPYKLGKPQELLEETKQVNALFFAGIANTKPVEVYLKEYFNKYDIVELADHFKYTQNNLNDIKKRYTNWAVKDKILLTTQKDAVKLNQKELKNTLSQVEVYVLPVEMEMDKVDEQQFAQRIETYIAKERSNTIEENK